MAKKSIPVIAEALRKNVEAQDKLDAKLKPLKEAEEGLREEMMVALIAAGLDSAKHKGQIFSRKYRINYAIQDLKKATEWAEAHGLLRIDKTAANKLLAREIVTPDGFERVEEEHLAIKTEKNDAD